jgi:hypothetical protein
VRVDFYLYATHEVATATPVLTTLRGWGVDAAFVLEPPGRHVALGSVPDPRRGWLDVKDAGLVPLVDDELHATLIDLVATTDVPLVTAPRGDAAVAMTTQGSDWLWRYDGAALVRLSYGVGLVEDSYGHGDVNCGFDLVLAHGAFSAAAIEAAVPDVRAVPAGYPKWARFLRGDCAVHDARERLGLDADRPTLVYAPTWAHRSSLEAMATVLAGLPSRWQVVVKPHHNSLHLEPGRLDALLELVPSTDLSARHDLVPYLTAADVVVTDAVSGAFTESLLASRAVIGLATGSERLHPAARQCAPVLTDVADVPRVLADAPWARYAADAQRWAGALFQASGGYDDERAGLMLLQRAAPRSTRIARRTRTRAGNVARRIRRESTRRAATAGAR